MVTTRSVPPIPSDSHGEEAVEDDPEALAGPGSATFQSLCLGVPQVVLEDIDASGRTRASRDGEGKDEDLGKDERGHASNKRFVTPKI